MAEGGRLVVEERVVEDQAGNFNLVRLLPSTLAISTYPLLCVPSFRLSMASSSALPTIHQLLEQVSLLLQRGSRTEAETISMALQCLELKGQIEQTKASVVEERMKQLVCKDEIAHLKKVTAPRCSGSKSRFRNRCLFQSSIET